MNKGIPPRLAIKSSFPNYLESLILVYILWLNTGKQASFNYGEEYQNSENLIKLKFTDLEIQEIKDYLSIAATDTPKFLVENPLLDQQIEPLQIGLLNFLKIGRVTFQNNEKNNTAERVGNERFKKTIKLTAVIDLLDQVLQDDASSPQVFLNILEKNNQEFEHTSLYRFLIFFISFWAEQTRYKDRSGEIHDNILDVTVQDIGLYKDGPARVIKKLIADNRYYYNRVESSQKIELAKRIERFSDIFKPVYLEETASDLNNEETSKEGVVDRENNDFFDFQLLSDIPKNILIKGVPGTGKSTAINNLIKSKFKPESILHDKQGNRIDRFLRVNIHSATTNASMMQGVGVSTDGSRLVYNEKKGLILNFLLSAILNPTWPFALILEEIQENTLNSLIGDLIYLMEPAKRTDLTRYIDYLSDDPYKFIERVVEADVNIDFVSIPNLIDGSQDSLTKKLIFPNNLYLFCTSNYRDDKKIIEDNLLRRFEVIEIYPQSALINNELIRNFFETLNKVILTTIDSDLADKCLIGHANWMSIKPDEGFYRALLKTVIELKDIRGIDFETVKEILNHCPIPEQTPIELGESFYDLIRFLQEKSNYTFL